MVESIRFTPRDPGVYASKAVELQRSGRKQRAKGVLLRAARAAENDEAKWASVVGILRGAALDDLFVATLDHYARAHPSRAGAWAMLGRAFQYLDRPADAVQTFEHATSIDPSSVEAWFEHFWAALHAHQYQSSLRAADQLAALDAEAAASPLFLASKAISLCGANRLDEALDALRSIPSAKADGALRIYLTRAYADVAESLVSDGRAGDALRLLETGHGGVEDLYERARVSGIRGLALSASGDFEGALVAFETMAAKAADAPTKWLARSYAAMALERLGRFPEALASIDGVLDGEPDDATRRNAELVRARLLQATGRLADALHSYNGIDPEKLEPTARRDLFVGHALALIQSGRNEEALDALRRGEAASDDPEAIGVILFWRASALRRLGRAADALEVLGRADAAGLPEPLRALAGVEYGVSLHALGRNDEALARIDQALKSQLPAPAAFALLQARGRILANGRRFQDALDAYALAREQASQGVERGATLLDMAHVAEALGRSADAKLLAGSSLDEVPDAAPFQELRSAALGVVVRASLALGEKRTALDALDRLLELTPGPDVPLPLLRIRLELLLHFGEPQRALTMLEDLDRNGAASLSHPYVIFTRGEILRQLGRDPAEFLAAMEAAARVPEAFERESLAWMAVAMASTVRDQWPDAERALARVVELEPAAAAQPAYLAYIAMVQHGLRNHSQALAALDGVKDSTGLDGMLVSLSRGQILMALRRFDEAVHAFGRVIELHSAVGHRDVTVSANAIVGRGQALFRLRRLDEAMEAFDEALRLLENAQGFAEITRISATVGRAFIYQERERQVEAVTAADQAIALSARLSAALPYRGLAWWCKGSILHVQNNVEDALTLFRRAGREGMPGNMAAIAEGNALLTLEDWDGALAAFESALALAAEAEQKFEAYSGKGRALHRRHDLQQAVEMYRAALALDCKAAKESPVIHQRLGETYYALRRYRAALEAYRRGWERERGGRRSPDLALGVSAALIQLGENREALSFLEQAESLAKEDERLTYNRAVALTRLGQIDVARTLLVRASGKGLASAGELLARISRGASGANGWLDYWFGTRAELGTRALGVLLLSFVVFALAVPTILLLSDAAVDWRVVLAAPAAAFLLLVLPGVGKLAFSYGDLKFETSPSSPDSGDAVANLSKMAVDLMLPGSLGAHAPRIRAQASGSVSGAAYALASSVTLIRRG